VHSHKDKSKLEKTMLAVGEKNCQKIDLMKSLENAEQK